MAVMILIDHKTIIKRSWNDKKLICAINSNDSLMKSFDFDPDFNLIQKKGQREREILVFFGKFGYHDYFSRDPRENLEY